MKRILMTLLMLVTLMAGGCKSTGDVSESTHGSDINSSGTSSETNSNGNSDTSNNSNSNSEVENPVKIITPVKVYINPSVQVNNIYANGLGTEAKNMNDIAELMMEKLEKYNSYIDATSNSSYKTLSNSVKESNNLQSDIHLALHTNAGGGKGSEIFTKNNTAFARKMYQGFNTLGNFNERGVKDGNHLYEVKNSTASHVALIEFLFHDNATEAQFIVSHKDEIATNLVDSLMEFIIDQYGN